MSTVIEEVSKKRVIPLLEESPEFREAVARCQSAEDALKLVRSGTSLWKVRSYSKSYRRRFFLDEDDGVLRYEPSRKVACRGGPWKVDISEIVDVRKGWKTDTFNRFGSKVVDAQRGQKKKKKTRGRGPKQGELRLAAGGTCADKPVIDEAACFSVVYGPARDSLDLVAASPELAGLWVRALRHLVTALRGLRQEERFNRWLLAQFTAADRDRSGSLAFDECLKLLKQLNVRMSRNEARKLFDKANTDKAIEQKSDEEPSLDSKEFIAFFQMLMKRPEIDEIYDRYARGTEEMTTKELQKFLEQEQHQRDVTLDDCRALIDAFEQSDELRKMQRLSSNGFTNLLLSEQMEIFKVRHRQVCQDMTQPLSSYYISSSHNTYLLGGQIAGESSVEGYIEALKMGCRCIELDCWDGPGDEPVITHGYTLTSKILVRDVLTDAIQPYAFTASQYPLILSLENHCSTEQQQKLATHLTSILGDLLYTDPVPEDLEQLPSPDALRHKILIKARKPAVADDSDSSSDSQEEDNDQAESSSEDDASPTTLQPNLNRRSSQRKKKKDSSKNLRVTNQNLSDLVNLCQGVHFHGFSKEGKCYQMVSFSESKALNLINNSGSHLVRFNSKRLCRIYPSGTRTGSSNFKPNPYWNAGCQLVALNYQNNKKPMFFNVAWFRANGSCGYILKPEYLRMPNVGKYSYSPVSNTLSENRGLSERRCVLELKIISGQNLPKPDQEMEGEVVDPYVKVKIVGHPVDKQKYQTHAIHDNGFNPQWNCKFTLEVELPELALIYFIVKDQNSTGVDRTLGSWAQPFTSLAEGYRHVPLLDMKRKPLSPATLFVHVAIT